MTMRRGVMKIVLGLAAAGLLVVLAGCMPAVKWGLHPELTERAKAVHAIGVAPASVKIYQLSAGGVKELVSEWSDSGRRNVTSAVVAEIARKSVGAQTVDAEKETADELEDVFRLYEAIATSITWHTYPGEHLFPEKLKRFEYSVGPIDRILKKCKSDALLVVYAHDEISTGGRKALMALSSIPLIGGAAPHRGITAVSMGLFDRSGALLWYNDLGNAGDFDLRDSRSAAAVIHHVMATFPREIR